MADESDTRRPSSERRAGDERLLDKVLGFQRSTSEGVSQLTTKITLIESEQRHILKGLEQLVSKLEFTPVKLLVYGMTSIILTAVIGALVLLVLKQ